MSYNKICESNRDKNKGKNRIKAETIIFSILSKKKKIIKNLKNNGSETNGAQKNLEQKLANQKFPFVTVCSTLHIGSVVFKFFIYFFL